MKARLSSVNMVQFGAGCTLLAMLLVAGSVLALAGRLPVLAQEPLAEPPADQTYMGTKQCSSCHFDQFMSYKTTKHAKAFEELPTKYQADATCMKCHTTGFGQPTGYKDKSTPDLKGVGCEVCHGPGSKHVEVAKTFGDKKLSDTETAYVKSTIHKMLPQNICAQCHSAQAHKKHVDFEKDKAKKK